MPRWLYQNRQTRNDQLFLIGVASDQMAAIFPSMFVEAAVDAEPLAQQAADMVEATVDTAATAGMVETHHHEMRAGKGRYVVLLMSGMEHALLLLLLLTELYVARAPAWVRLAIARREYEARAPKEAKTA